MNLRQHKRRRAAQTVWFARNLGFAFVPLHALNNLSRRSMPWSLHMSWLRDLVGDGTGSRDGLRTGEIGVVDAGFTFITSQGERISANM